MSIDLDAIRARCEAATSGPWVVEAIDGSWPWVWRADRPNSWGGIARLIDRHEPDADGVDYQHGAVCSVETTDGQQEALDRADAEFIAHARQDIPDLLRALEAALARIAELEDES